MSNRKIFPGRAAWQSQSFLVFVLVLGCFLSGVFTNSVYALPVAWLRQVKPTVEVKSGDKAWSSARERTRLRFGDFVRAGQKGKTVIQFNNGTRFTLRGGSQIQLVSPATSKKPLVVRVFGALSEVFVHARGGVEIRTAAGTAAVRGTEYLVRVTDDTSTQVTVTEGRVAFFNTQGEVLLNPGFQSRAQIGTAPSTPTAVDVSGLLQWTADISALPVDVEIPFVSNDRAVLNRALVERRAAVSNNAADAGAHGRLGQVHFDLGEYSRAVEQLTVATRLDPQNAEWLVGLGQAQRAQGDAKSAIATLSEAVRLAPQNTSARAALALAHLSDGDAEKARDLLGDSNADEAAFTGVTRAVVALRSGDYDGAEKASDAVLKSYVEYSPALLTRALALLGRGEVDEAQKTAVRLTQAAPRSAQAQGVLSLVLFFGNRVSEAGIAANRAVDLDPYSPFALFAQGRVLLAQGQKANAMDVLGQAAALAPHLPGLNEELGAVYLLSDLPLKAEAAYRAALQQNPDSLESQAGYGAALHAQGRIEEAEKHFRLSLEKEPKNSSVRIRLAQLLIEQGQLDAAQQELEKGTGDSPERGLMWVKMSENSLYRQRLDEAQEYARKAVSLLPNSSLARYQLGRVYLERDQIVQAETQFRRAVALDSQNAQALYALGVVRERTQGGLWGSVLAPGSAAVGSTGSSLSLQNLQSPGAAERVQGISQDASVVRSATRSFGNTEVSGVIGQDDVREAEFSHLQTSKDRRGVLALTAESRRSDGTFDNRDQEFERFGFIYGKKQRETPSGFWAIAQYEQSENTYVESDPFLIFSNISTRYERKIPRLLAGYNWERDDSSRTRILVQAAKPEYSVQFVEIPGSYADYQFESLNAEVRHDRKIGNNQTLNFGLFGGKRSREVESFNPDIDPAPSRLKADLTSYGVYARNEWRPNERWSVAGELLWQSLQFDSSFSAKESESQFLPKVIVAYQPNSKNSLRLRLSRIAASVEDFQLLRPTDGFLDFRDVSQPMFNSSGSFLVGRGNSAELEWDRTFGDSSFLQVTLFSQKIDNAFYEGWSGGNGVDNVRQKGARVGYEALMGNNTSFFSRLYWNDAEANGERLPQIPRFSAALGLQYLNRRGWFVQPLVNYQGSRTNDATGERLDSAAVFNLRAGKRWGLERTAFIELRNAFDEKYSVGKYDQYGRQLRVGYTQRF